MNAIKYEVQKKINKEKDLLKELEGMEWATPISRHFTNGRINAFEEVLKLIKENK